MEWDRFTGWLEAMKRQQDASKPKPDSWSVYDPWFDQQIAQRRQRQRGF